ncbi:hypothetical protein CYMTET_3628 [Cymbomonas tetramitiformis]|uniref:PH domain-containing protein n=1 Tax=Cymbomonas tetramitiformis TaxID=36881 RepID=A0AAE0H394_9CHLO|nr:hypothetical protein CYMTET_3628 [Cymbomonas tetramitiformis]
MFSMEKMKDTVQSSVSELSTPFYEQKGADGSTILMCVEEPMQCLVPTPDRAGDYEVALEGAFRVEAFGLNMANIHICNETILLGPQMRLVAHEDSSYSYFIDSNNNGFADEDEVYRLKVPTSMSDDFNWIVSQYCEFCTLTAPDPTSNDNSPCLVAVAIERTGELLGSAMVGTASMVGTAFKMEAKLEKKVYKPGSSAPVNQKDLDRAAKMKKDAARFQTATAKLSSAVMFPIRQVGNLVGNQVAQRAAGDEAPTGCRMKKVGMDIAGGVGNALTAFAKGQQRAADRLYSDFEEAQVEKAKHMGGTEHVELAKKRCDVMKEVSKGAYNIYATVNFADGAAQNIGMALAAEVADQGLNRDFYVAGPTLLQGYMEFKTNVPGATWQTLWVVLRNFALAYYPSAQDVLKKPLGVVPTSNTGAATLEEVNEEGPARIGVMTLDNSWFHLRPPVDLIQTWLASLKQAKDRVESVLAVNQLKIADRVDLAQQTVCQGPNLSGHWVLESEENLNGYLKACGLPKTARMGITSSYVKKKLVGAMTNPVAGFLFHRSSAQRSVRLLCRAPWRLHWRFFAVPWCALPTSRHAHHALQWQRFALLGVRAAAMGHSVAMSNFAAAGAALRLPVAFSVGCRL